MPKTVTTPEIEKYILKNRLKMSAANIGAQFGISGTAVLGYLRRNGLSLTKAESMAIKSVSMSGRTTVTKKQDRFIRKNYLTMPIKTMETAIDKSQTAVRCRLRQLGLSIPFEIIEQRKRDSRIKLGTAPPNKGKKQSEYMSPEQIAKTVATRFKKGHIPMQAAEGDGVIRIRSDEMKNGVVKHYKWIRLSLGKWRMYHVYLWEAEHGPVPKGHIIIFKDGDSLNTVPENLEMITLAENMRRNTIHRYQEEVRHVMQLRGAINRQINKRSKKNNDEQK